MLFNTNPVPHNGGRFGYWYKLVPGQTAQNIPMVLLYDAPARKRLRFDVPHQVATITQTYDNSKAIAVLTYPTGNADAPTAAHIVPFIVTSDAGRLAVKSTVGAEMDWYFDTEASWYSVEQTQSVDANRVRLWGTYQLKMFDSANGPLPGKLGQPVGGRILYREYVDGFVEDNAYHWTGHGRVFDRTLRTWNPAVETVMPLDPQHVVAFATWSRTITYHDEHTPPTVTDEEPHYNMQDPGTDPLPGQIFDGYGEGYVEVDVEIDGFVAGHGDRVSVMMNTLEDNYRKVDLSAETGLYYNIATPSRDICPIGSPEYACYVHSDDTLTVLHYGLVGPPPPSLQVRPGPKAVRYE